MPDNNVAASGKRKYDWEEERDTPYRADGDGLARDCPRKDFGGAANLSIHASNLDP